MRVLVTGATGKVGQNFLPAFLASDRFAGATAVALCNNRVVAPHPRVEVVKGSLSDAGTIAAALAGVTHVVHMAAVKESPDLCMDVSVKGLFLLLEAFRASADAEQFILIGGDCSVGHIFHGYDAPVTEAAPRRAYPGCYALTKVIEEVMLEQYQIQYGLNGCILRAPWIMEKDDFRYALSFGADQFGGPPWTDLLPEDEVARHAAEGRVPLMLDRGGRPLRRNFVHVDDLVSAILAALGNPAATRKLFNISMNQPVDYGRLAALLKQTRGLDPVEIATPFHSNWLDNARARADLGWQPDNDLEALIERAWSFERSPDDPRRIWYPG
ncbi:MAG: NAD(P)-dependent oxidoreductase [Maritimibacter sp.]|nr:NAD(P)-dependent oxidoreductase [Maritimibacter sp.]